MAGRGYQKDGGAPPVTDAPRVDWATVRQLPADGLHVWRIALSPAPSPSVAMTLPAEELARAGRLVDPAARERFLALRQALRAILARYVDSAPEGLRFGREARGKPFLVEPPSDWAFNLSDSRDLALLAVSRAGPVGVDLEHLRTVPRRDGIARRIFTAEQVAALEESPAEARDALFFQHWTAFEALQKATGAGLAGPRADPAAWRVRHFVPTPGCIAALAHGAAIDTEILFLSYAG